MNRPSLPYIFRSGEQSAPRFVVGDRSDLARVIHEAAELRLSGGRRRYIEHLVGHFAVRSAAFLLDASVETTILGGVGVDRVVLSRSEDEAIGLAMIVLQRIAYGSHGGQRRGRGEGHESHSAIDIEHIDRVVAGDGHDGVVLEGRARRQRYVDGRHAIHRVGMADELLEMEQLQLGDVDTVDLECKTEALCGIRGCSFRHC